MKKEIYQIPMIDGASQALFCSQMNEDEAWKYRVRYLNEEALEDLPPQLTEWREYHAIGRQVFIPSIASHYIMEVEARVENAGEWSKVTLRELAETHCQFKVKIISDVSVDQEGQRDPRFILDVLASVRGGTSGYRLTLPKEMGKIKGGSLLLPEGLEFELEGRNLFTSIYNILVDSGDFTTNSPRVSVENISASENNFQECTKDARCRPLVNNGTFYMAATGERLSDDERESLEESLASGLLDTAREEQDAS